MRKLSVAIILFALAGSLWAQESRYVLTRQQWNVPRSVPTVLQMPALNQAMAQFTAQRGARLRLRYPGGDEGTLWAMEVRSWLVSLGLGSGAIELLPGSRRSGALEIEVITPTIEHTNMPRQPGL